MERDYPERVSDPVQNSEQEIARAGLCAYINAGGRGTRLNKLFTPDEKIGITKGLLRLESTGETLLETHINALLDEDMETIIAGVGDHYNAHQFVVEKYDENGRVHAIHYSDQLGNGGDLVRAVRDYPELFSDNIYIVNVDTFASVNKERVRALHAHHDADLTFILTTSQGVPNYQAFHVGYNDEILHTDEDDTLTPPADLATRTRYRASSTGGMIISKRALQAVDWQPEHGDLGLYKDIVGKIISSGAAFAYNNKQEEFIDVGTVDTWKAINNPSHAFNNQSGGATV